MIRKKNMERIIRHLYFLNKIDEKEFGRSTKVEQIKKYTGHVLR